MELRKKNLNVLFVTYGGTHYKLFRILHDNFNAYFLMHSKFKYGFKKHFNYIGDIDLKFSNSCMGLFLNTVGNLKHNDIIIAHCPISGVITYLACLFSRKKRVFLMCQDFYEYFDVSEKRFFRRLIYGNLLKIFIKLSCRKSLVIALSRYVKTKAEGYGAKKVEIIPVYGIDTGIFKPKKNKINFHTKDKIILSAARIAPEKGMIYLLEAISELNNVLLILAGNGDKENLKLLIKQLNLQEKVRVLGEIDPIKIADYYNACDIFVLPSLKEGLGFSSAEAMACKKPVIASNTGGIPDIVINNKTGILVEPGNAVQLRGAIIKLLSSKTLCKKFAENGYKYVKKNYQEKDITKKFVSVLVNENKL